MLIEYSSAVGGQQEGGGARWALPQVYIALVHKHATRT